MSVVQAQPSGVPGGEGLEDGDERVPFAGADRVDCVREACGEGEDRRCGGERGDGREIEEIEVASEEEREQDNGGVRNTVEIGRAHV